MPPSRSLRRVGLTVLAAALALGGGGAGVGCALSAPVYRGPVSDHFDGTRFVTPGGGDGEHASLGRLLRWQASRQPEAWPAFHDEPPGPRPPAEVGPGQLRVTFINHATTLLQLDGLNVLTDPIYSQRCSPFDFAGPARVRPPGIRFEDLPRIDAVLVSHNHYDHLDAPTLKRIAERWPAVRFFVGLGNRAYLERLGLTGVEELDWWEARALKGVTVRSVPNQHFSGRGPFDGDGTLWTAWVLEGRAGRAYFAGDTGYGPHFAETERRLGPMRLAVLPIGAFRPEWFMGPVHQSPVQAVQAARDLRAGLAVPMHYGTFNLADDGETEPVRALRAAVADAGVNFEVLGFGEGRDVP
jgi:L-ascorbate metabolism protein UlaG (beta-lactamase superfamily)